MGVRRRPQQLRSSGTVCGLENPSCCWSMSKMLVPVMELGMPLNFTIAEGPAGSRDCASKRTIRVIRANWAPNLHVKGLMGRNGCASERKTWPNLILCFDQPHKLSWGRKLGTPLKTPKEAATRGYPQESLSKPTANFELINFNYLGLIVADFCLLQADQSLLSV